ncbi:MAG: MFS transporter [Catenulisporales bacterium]|nr:MFS transporter [Catenulisporales bacterium]
MTNTTNTGVDRPDASSGDISTPDPKRWLALAVILSAAFMDLLDVTIVNVAIPSIQSQMKAGYSAIQWITAGYALAFAVVLITGGRLGDIYGRKRLFLIGMTGFTVASALCGLAATPGVLIGARVLQGGMAALMVPQVMAIIHVTFPANERGKVMGMFGAIVGSAAVAGPILGGLLVQWNLFGLHWRPIFLVNLPVGVFGLIVAFRVISESRAPHATKLDLPGVGLSVVGLFMLVFPLMQGRDLDWPVWGWIMMAAAVPVLAVFVLYERRKGLRAESPLVELGLFRFRSFASGILTNLTFSTTLGVFFLVWALYMQLGLGWTPLHAGLTGIPFSIGVSAAAGMSVQFLVPRFGRKVVQFGVLLMAGGMVLYIEMAKQLDLSFASWQMALPLLVTGVGMGLVVAPIFDLILTDVPMRDAGSASGLLNTSQQLGQAFGIALTAVVFFNLMGTHAAKAVDDMKPDVTKALVAVGVPAAQADPVFASFKQCAVDHAKEKDPSDTPASCRPSPGQNPDVGAVLQAQGARATQHTMVGGFETTLWFVAGGQFFVFLLMFFLPKNVRAKDSEDDADAVGAEDPEDVAPVFAH